ncbi:NF038396 family protein [Citricoccus nitrophenolicus]
MNKTTLTFIAFIACPILGLVTAVMGLVMIFTDNVLMGVIFLVVLTQVFIFGGLWALMKRRSLTGDPGGQ